jgi:hypothetical protein
MRVQAEQAREAAAQARMQGDREAEQRANQFALQMQQLQSQMQQAKDEAQARLQDSQSRLEESRAEREARGQQHSDSLQIERDKLGATRSQMEEASANLERERLLAPLESTHGIGVRHLAEGDYETPEAEKALRSMAAASDQSWWGFRLADAQRMDAILKRLGVNDDAARQQLVETFGYGLSNNFLGMGGRGRGELSSYWLASRPW